MSKYEISNKVIIELDNLIVQKIIFMLISNKFEKITQKDYTKSTSLIVNNQGESFKVHKEFDDYVGKVIFDFVEQLYMKIKNSNDNDFFEEFLVFLNNWKIFTYWVSRLFRSLASYYNKQEELNLAEISVKFFKEKVTI